jgi:hypothetical protein
MRVGHGKLAAAPVKLSVMASFTESHTPTVSAPVPESSSRLGAGVGPANTESYCMTPVHAYSP